MHSEALPSIDPMDKVSFGAAFALRAASQRLRRGSSLADKVYDAVLARLADRHEDTQTFREPVPVPRETDISVEDYVQRYVVPGRPVVLAGLCRDWPAVQRWSEPFFRGQAMTLPGIDTEQDAERWLQTPHRLLHDLPHLGEDLRPGLLRRYARLDDGDPFTVKLFSGPAHIPTRLHMDVGTNFLVHLHGTKRFTMFHREDTPFVYSEVELKEYSFYSECNGLVGSDDDLLERWPLLAYATRLETTLEPGDALYIPPFAWHLPHYDTFCLSAACWWHESPLAYIKEAPVIGSLSGPAYVQAHRYNQQLRRDHPGREYVPLTYSQPA